VANEKNRKVRVITGYFKGDFPHIIKDSLPPLLFGKKAQFLRVGNGFTMPPVIMTEHQKSLLCQRLSNMVVPPDMLCHPVNDLNHCPGGAFRNPEHPGDDFTIRDFQAEIFYLQYRILLFVELRTLYIMKRGVVKHFQ